MKPKLTVIAVFCSANLLFGCTNLPREMQVTVVPALKVRHTYETADAYYSLGRYHYGSRRFDEAIKSYRQALEINPGHTRVQSALGILYAERGDYTNAIATLKTAADAEPNNSSFFSNLGYAYILNGEYAHAEQALEKATLIEPNNLRAWHNLALLMGKLKRHEQATVVFTRIESLKKEELSNKLSTASDTAALPLHDAALSTKSFTPVLAQDMPLYLSTPNANSQTRIREVSPSIYEIQRGATKSASIANSLSIPPAANGQFHPISRTVGPYRGGKAKQNEHCARPSPVWQKQANSANNTTPSTLQIEISNGNGINGMAGLLGRMICGYDIEIARLTNQKTFAIATTRIEYSARHEMAARALAKYLTHSTLSKVQPHHLATDIRVVLGKDLANIDSLVLRAPSPITITRTGTNSKS